MDFYKVLEEERIEIHQLATDQHGKMLRWTGESGIGKSHLVLEFRLLRSRGWEKGRRWVSSDVLRALSFSP